jgi:hypothetical protein
MRNYLLLLTALCFFSNCTIINKVTSDYDKEVDFSRIKTYQLYNEGIAKIQVNNLDKRRMIKAVEERLTTRGLTKSEQPDILVNIVVTTGQVYESAGGYVGGGYVFDYTKNEYVWTSSTYSPTANSAPTTETVLMIDFIDPATKNLIWHGQSKGFKIDNYYNREENINFNIKLILDQYPPQQ